MFNRKKKEKISKKVLEHSSFGTFKRNKKNNQLRFISGGHGQENINFLKKENIGFSVNVQYPNGVRMGDVPSHKETYKRKNNGQVWFPKKWTRKTIKKAGEKAINSIPYKLPDDKITFGVYKGVKVGVRRNAGKVSTVFPYYKQSGRVKKWKKKIRH